MTADHTTASHDHVFDQFTTTGLWACKCGVAQFQQPPSGQPQQEPATPYVFPYDGDHVRANTATDEGGTQEPASEPIGNRLAREFKDDPEFIAEQKAIEEQERQAGGHVHERGDQTNLGVYECRFCGEFRASSIEWNYYRRGVADAAAARRQ